MENELNCLKKLLKEKEIPEFISLLPKELVSDDLKPSAKTFQTISMAEISLNSELLSFIHDIPIIPFEIDLNVVENLLSKYKPVENEFFKDGNKAVSITSDFQTASGKNISSKAEEKSTDKENDKDCNVDAYIIERIKMEILESNLNVNWDDIVGLENVKKSINEIVLWPMMRPDIFKGLRGPPKGLLLFGPPGTGKTMIGKCIASQCKATFFSISASSLTSKWVGEGEKMVRALFYLARKMSPSVIFIDEIDSLLSQRTENENEGSRRIKTEFLVQFDGAAVNDEEQILVMGATNRPQEIDEAARRRLVKRIYVPLPEEKSREKMISHLLKDFKNEIDEEKLKSIAKMTEGYSGSDMFNLCREATLEPLREIDDINNFKAEDTRPIKKEDFEKAMKQIRKSVSNKDLDCYMKWNNDFGSIPM